MGSTVFTSSSSSTAAAAAAAAAEVYRYISHSPLAFSVSVDETREKQRARPSSRARFNFMKRPPTPASARTSVTSRGGYLSNIKAAAAAAASAFATTSRAIADAAPSDRSPVALDFLATPSKCQWSPPRAKTPISARNAAHVPQQEQAWVVRRKTLRAVLQPAASSAAPFYEAMGCNSGAIGVIRLPRNASAHLYPAANASAKSPATNCDFFISARDEQSRTEWQIALQLELEGASCHDALSSHNENRRALHAQQELEEAVRSRNSLVAELAACEKELLELKLANAATNQREAAAVASNSSLIQRIAKIEAELRKCENEKHELRGRMSQVAATADSEHSRLAAAECSLRDQNTAQLKRIAILEERVEAFHKLQSEHQEALCKISSIQLQLEKVTDEKREATRELHDRIEKCKSLERLLSKAKEASASDEKDMFAARAAAARALDDAAACRLRCNQLDEATWSQKDKLSKAQEALVPLRKRADAAEQLAEKYEKQLEDARLSEKRLNARVSQLEKENQNLKSDVQSLAAEKQCMRLELLQANLENDKVNALRATIKSLELEKAALVARDRNTRTGGQNR